MLGGAANSNLKRLRWSLAIQPLMAVLAPVVLVAPMSLARAAEAPEDGVIMTAPAYALVTGPVAEDVAPETNRLNQSRQDVILVVPVREAGPLGQAEVRITPDDEVYVSAADIARALSRGASEATVSAVLGQASSDGFVSLDALQAVGVSVTFDRSAIELVVALDADSRMRRTIPLGFETLSDPPLADQSEPFSIALSYQASLDYEHVGADQGLQSPRVNLDLNGRFKPFAFENQFSYDGNLDDDRFRRQASRLIFDQPFKSLRWTAGDQVSQPVSFQNSVDVAGFGLSRLTQTYEAGRSLAASTSRSLTLRAPATVEIYVNGLPVRTVQLPAGVYDLTDLPLTAGANAVQIVVQDEAGGRQVINFDFFSDFELLAPGLSEFDFQAGVRAPFIDGVREYGDEPVATGFYRRGLTEQLTGGLNFQISEIAQQVGAEALWGTPVGLFNFDGSVSNIDGIGSGFAGRVQYRLSQDMSELRGVRRLDLSVEHRSRNFGSLEDVSPVNRFSWVVTARYSQPLRPDIAFNAGADYAVSRDGREDRYGGSAGLSWRYDNRTSINGRLSYISDTFGDRDEWSVGVTAVRRFGIAGSASASFETRDDRYQFGIARAPIRPLNDFGYSAQLIRSDGDYGVDGSLTWFSNRGDVGVAHQTSFDEGGDVVSQVSSLRAAGSIAMAGNRVAVGRRVGNAFAIVEGHPTLEGADVLVGGRFTDDVIARTDAFGLALAPLGAYSRQTVIYDAPDAPAGYDLGSGAVELYPWLHSGYVITVGSAYNVTAVGNLLDADGNPLVLKGGVARSLTDPDAPPQQMFTNRAGRFGVSGLSIGRWRLSMTGGLDYELEIVSSQGALVQVGVLRPLTGDAAR